MMELKTLPNGVNTATVNGFSINTYPSGGALVTPPYQEFGDFPDVNFTEQDLRDLAMAATWAADRMRAK